MFDAMNQNYHFGFGIRSNAGSRYYGIFLNTKISIPKGAAIFHIKTKKPKILVGFCIMNKDYKYDFNYRGIKIYIKKLNLEVGKN